MIGAATVIDQCCFVFFDAAKAPRKMNLTWLDDFLALASTGNFSRAAEERHMTQPAFSRRIRALEEWLGVVLFDRSSQPAVLRRSGCCTAPSALAFCGR